MVWKIVEHRKLKLECWKLHSHWNSGNLSWNAGNFTLTGVPETWNILLLQLEHTAETGTYCRNWNTKITAATGTYWNTEITAAITVITAATAVTGILVITAATAVTGILLQLEQIYSNWNWNTAATGTNLQQPEHF